MNYTSTYNTLFITNKNEEFLKELFDFLNGVQCQFEIEYELGSAINRAQNKHFDIVVLDAEIKSMPIEKIIQIFRDLNPQIKIIVRTKFNSKDLEAKVRKEKIYYYHLDSFGIDDLTLALKSALNIQDIQLSERKANSQKKLILMVDENDDFLEIHKTNLESHNYNVEICYDADEAYIKAEENIPDLIMIDIGVPIGKSGNHFIEKLTMNVTLLSIPILIFASVIELDKFQKLIQKAKSQLKKWSILEKPVKIEDMVPIVEKLLSDI